MANQEHLTKLKQGVAVWNQWRQAHGDIAKPDLSGADLYAADLRRANLRGADLRGANLHHANLLHADLSEADLSSADLRRVNFHATNLRGADLRGATLRRAILVETNLEGASFSDCDIYGISVWSPEGIPKDQDNLKITPSRSDRDEDQSHNAPTEEHSHLTVHDLEVAQFISLLYHNEKIRHVIDAATSQAVLILGRFEPLERKAVLNMIGRELRRQNYVPILFDFEPPQDRDFTETISTLARLTRFIIADLTGARSLPQELAAIVPTLAVPVQPILTGTSGPYSLFHDNWKYSWVLPIYRYKNCEGLIASLGARVIGPAEVKVQELTALRGAQAEARLTPQPASGG